MGLFKILQFDVDDYSMWYEGFAREQGNSAGTYDEGPARLVLHTTEGSSVESAVAAYKKNNSWPHFTVDPVKKIAVQHVDTAVPARALKNLAGGVETNREHAIQVEIVGRAAETHNMPDEQIKWLAEILGPVIRNEGIRLVTVPFYGQDAGWTLASTNAKQRMSNHDWENFNGICGHQHVPENCVASDTKILKADLTWVQAKDLKPGDEIIAFDETPEPGFNGGRRFTTTVVTENQPFVATGYRVETEFGSVVTTGDHPWLVDLPYVNHGRRVEFKQTLELKPGKHRAYYIGAPWEIDNSREAGYLAGLIDADGHVTTSRDAGTWVGFGQVPNGILDAFIEGVHALGFKTSSFNRSNRVGGYSGQPFVDVKVNGGIWATARLLGMLQPQKKIRFLDCLNGAVVGKSVQKAEIYSVEEVGPVQFAGLTTASKTYIADGFLMHNTHWDPGKFPIKKFIAYLEAQGEDDMAKVMVQPPQGHSLYGSWWITDGMFASWVRDGDTYNLLKFLGAKDNEGVPFVLTAPQFDMLIPVQINENDPLHRAHATHPRYQAGVVAQNLAGTVNDQIVASENRQNGAIAQAVVQSEQRISQTVITEIKKIIDAIDEIEIVEGDCDCPDEGEIVNEFLDRVIQTLQGLRV